MSYFWPLPALGALTFDGFSYDEIFPPEFFGQLSELMGVEHTQEALSALRSGHYQAFLAFNDAKVRRDTFEALKDENTRLKRIAKEAEKLFQSLSELHEFGQAQDSLLRSIDNNPTHFSDRKGRSLMGLLNTESGNQPFYALQQILSDLGMSAERAIIAKPREIPAIGAATDAAALFAMIEARDWSYTGTHEENLALWEKRREEHRQQDDQPLRRFVEAFRPVWDALSPFLFSQGHYYEKIGHSPSRAIAALKLSLERHAPEVTEQNIVTAIRRGSDAA